MLDYPTFRCLATHHACDRWREDVSPRDQQRSAATNRSAAVRNTLVNQILAVFGADVNDFEERFRG